MKGIIVSSIKKIKSEFYKIINTIYRILIT